MSVVGVRIEGVRGNKAMRRFDTNFRSYDAPAVVRLTANKAAGVARSMSPPGKSRDLNRQEGAPNEAKSRRTDARFGMQPICEILQTEKAAVFVPVTLSAYAKVTDDGIAPKIVRITQVRCRPETHRQELQIKRVEVSANSDINRAR